jgi:hypothetical protein
MGNKNVRKNVLQQVRSPSSAQSMSSKDCCRSARAFKPRTQESFGLHQSHSNFVDFYVTLAIQKRLCPAQRKTAPR